MLQQIFEDLHTSLGFVVFCGGFVSMVVGFGFILLLQFLAPIVIWLIVLGIFVLLMVLDAYVFLRAGTFFGFDLSNVTSTIDDFSGPPNRDNSFLLAIRKMDAIYLTTSRVCLQRSLPRTCR